MSTQLRWYLSAVAPVPELGVHPRELVVLEPGTGMWVEGRQGRPARPLPPNYAAALAAVDTGALAVCRFFPFPRPQVVKEETGGQGQSPRS